MEEVFRRSLWIPFRYTTGKLLLEVNFDCLVGRLHWGSQGSQKVKIFGLWVR